MGAGLNLTLDEHDLPTLTSTSLLLATGARPMPTRCSRTTSGGSSTCSATLAAAGGDAAASGVDRRVSALCGTLGSEVRVQLPGEQELIGRAERLDRDGRLVVLDRENGEPQAVAAGDVTHLRY